MIKKNIEKQQLNTPKSRNNKRNNIMITKTQRNQQQTTAETTSKQKRNNIMITRTFKHNTNDYGKNARKRRSPARTPS